MGAANPNLCSRKLHRLTATWGFVGHANEALSLNAPEFATFVTFRVFALRQGLFDPFFDSCKSGANGDLSSIMQKHRGTLE